MRVLLVDDEGPILKAMGRMFSRRGCEVRTALSAEEALGLLDDAFTPDLVISDFKMPGKDGAALLAIIAERVPHCRRVLLSGYADYEGPLSATFVRKPFRPEELLVFCEASA